MTVLERFRLDGRAALVTGGNRGLGRAIATALAEAGAQVAIVSRQLEQAQAAAVEIQKSSGQTLKGYQCDVSDSEQIATLADSVRQDFGKMPLTALIVFAQVLVAMPMPPFSVQVIAPRGHVADGPTGTTTCRVSGGTARSTSRVWRISRLTPTPVMFSFSVICASLDALAPEGRLVEIATLQGAKAEVNIQTIMQRRLTVTGSTLRARPIADKGVIAAAVHRHVWPLLESGRVKPVIQQVFPAARAADAHAAMEAGHHVGKLMLSWA